MIQVYYRIHHYRCDTSVRDETEIIPTVDTFSIVDWHVSLSVWMRQCDCVCVSAVDICVCVKFIKFYGTSLTQQKRIDADMKTK